jgi:hypothetical protein
VGRRLVPVTLVAAACAFAVAAISAGLTLERPRLWSAAVALVVLGGITPTIYAVNLRILPVFSRRVWRWPRVLTAGTLSAMLGAWLVYLGRATGAGTVETLGACAALAGGLLYAVSVVALFRSAPTNAPAPPLPFAEQAAVDAVGVGFTRLAGLYLLLGLAVGVLLRFWTPERGRWDLVWAHTLLLGWFLSMASGVCYHVLPRWTSARWRTPRLIALHLRIIQLGLPLMLLALALNATALFMLAGPLLVAALLLFLFNVVPLVAHLPATTRLGVVLAGSFLVVGILLGGTFALDTVIGARLRLAHAELNLFGWSALLVCGMGYYLFPGFAGQPLRWPRLARGQLTAQACGVALSAGGWWWNAYVSDGARPLIVAGGFVTGLGMFTFAAIIAATFRGSGRAVVSNLTLQPRRVIKLG